MTSHLKLTALAAALVAMVSPAMAKAAPAIDCPARTDRYSLDTQMMDILLNPKAADAIEQVVPGLIKNIPKQMMSASAPSFSAIFSVREFTVMSKLSQDKVDAIAKGLAAVPVTAADQQARCARYEADAPILKPEPGERPRILLFDKSTGFRDGPSVDAARKGIDAIARRRGWSLTMTDKAGVMTAKTLGQYDVVIWSNVSGDVLTVPQRSAFRSYVEKGGGFIGLHGSSGDFASFWPWYRDTLIGAQFIGHPSNPQFQEASVIVDDPKSAIVGPLAPGWKMTDEWYSFKISPRRTGAHVLLRLDEATYRQVDYAGKNISMGTDHPIAWSRCVGNGRSFYSAIGHVPATYTQPQHAKLLENAILWASGEGETLCKAGREIPGAH